MGYFSPDDFIPFNIENGNREILVPIGKEISNFLGIKKIKS